MADDESRIEYLGPWTVYDVVVDGCHVPFLRAIPLDDGGVELLLDRRFGLRLTAEQAEQTVPFLANVIAVASGYTSHPRADDPERSRPRYPRN
jgi:hypothetical protein